MIFCNSEDLLKIKCGFTHSIFFKFDLTESSTILMSTPQFTPTQAATLNEKRDNIYMLEQRKKQLQEASQQVSSSF